VAFDWDVLMQAVEGALVAAWPEIKPPLGGGVMEAERAGRLDFEGRETPYAVMEFVGALPDRTEPITGRLYDAFVELHYITRREQGLVGLKEIRNRLDVLDSYLFVTGVPTVDYRITALLDWGSTYDGLVRFIGSEASYVGGSLTALFVCGEAA
jgi:hypothetical protein